MKGPSKRFAKLFSQYMPSATVFKCGLALLIICTVAAFVMAYYHDAYSSILELKEQITVVGTQYIFINLISRTLGLNNGYLLSIGLSLGVFFLCYLSHQLLRSPGQKVG